ncbi:MAG: hypothetical protein ACWA5L_11065 [bacterium]
MRNKKIGLTLKKKISILIVGIVSMGFGTVMAEEYPPDGTVKIEKVKNLKNVTKVYVPHFAISFVVADKKSAIASTERSNRFARKAQSTTQTELAGLTNETMQKITDKAYTEFIQMLADNGIEVIEVDAAAAQQKARRANLSMTKFLNGPVNNYSAYHKYYNKNIHDLTFSPTGTQLIAAKIGNTPIQNMYGAAAREFDVPVLAVDYILTYGHIAAEAREYYGIAGRGDVSANTSFQPGLQVMWSSDIKLYKTERKTGRLMIEKNAWTAAPFAKLEVDKWNGLARSGQKITVNVDNELYEKAANDVLSRASNNLITTLANQ